MMSKAVLQPGLVPPTGVRQVDDFPPDHQSEEEKKRPAELELIRAQMLSIVSAGQPTMSGKFAFRGNGPDND